MKRGTELKLKFRLLKKRLDLPLWQVKGLLQSLWDFASENALRGDVGRFTNDEIALAIEYEGDADLLVSTLIECRWLDAHPKHRLVIHGWKEHAEDWIAKRLARSGDGFAEDDAIENASVTPSAADNGGQRQTTADDGGRFPTTAAYHNHNHSHDHNRKPLKTGSSERSSPPASQASPDPSKPPAVPAKPPPKKGAKKPATEGTGEVVATIPLADGTEARVTSDIVDEWRKAFPGVDVVAELKKIRVYFLTEPRKRKTAAGIGKCVTSWLGRTQDRGGSRAQGLPPRGRSPNVAGMDLGDGIRRDRSGAPIPEPKKTETHDICVDGIFYREEYEVATGKALRRWRHKEQKI